MQSKVSILNSNSVKMQLSAKATVTANSEFCVCRTNQTCRKIESSRTQWNPVFLNVSAEKSLKRHVPTFLSSECYISQAMLVFVIESSTQPGMSCTTRVKRLFVGLSHYMLDPKHWLCSFRYFVLFAFDSDMIITSLSCFKVIFYLPSQQKDVLLKKHAYSGVIWMW